MQTLFAYFHNFFVSTTSYYGVYIQVILIYIIKDRAMNRDLKFITINNILHDCYNRVFF